MLPPTQQRVPLQTDESINLKIQDEIRRNIEYYSKCSPLLIDRRLRELEEEWDIERTLEFNAAALATGSILLGLAGRKRWLLLAGTVTAFLGQHALQGWCPPVPLFRRLGFRTAREIDQERHALKELRGDVKTLARDGEPADEERVGSDVTAVG